MEYNQPSEIVKDINFGDEAKKKQVSIMKEEKKKKSILSGNN